MGRHPNSGRLPEVDSRGSLSRSRRPSGRIRRKRRVSLGGTTRYERGRVGGPDWFANSPDIASNWRRRVRTKEGTRNCQQLGIIYRPWGLRQSRRRRLWGDLSFCDHQRDVQSSQVSVFETDVVIQLSIEITGVSESVRSRSGVPLQVVLTPHGTQRNRFTLFSWHCSVTPSGPRPWGSVDTRTRCVESSQLPLTRRCQLREFWSSPVWVGFFRDSCRTPYVRVKFWGRMSFHRQNYDCVT